MAEQRALTAEDRCDRCGAQARARTLHNNDQSDLLWCGHHFTVNKDKLIPHLVFLVDDDGQDRTKEAARA